MNFSDTLQSMIERTEFLFDDLEAIESFCSEAERELLKKVKNYQLMSAENLRQIKNNAPKEKLLQKVTD